MEITLKDKTKLALKRTGLTGGQVGNLVKESLSIYIGGDLFDNYTFNPIDMEINFYAGLFYLVLEDYSIDNSEEFERLFSLGAHNEILSCVENAQLAYDLMWKSANEMSNSLGILMAKLNKIADVFSNVDLEKLAKNLPGDVAKWNKVKNEYDSIMRIENNEGDN